MTTLYLAGPMRGIPLYNFPEFDRVAKILRDCGYRVISPADLDREFGFDPARGDKADDAFIRHAMERDIQAIIHQAGGIALLDGWDSSRGAQAEVKVGDWKGIKCWNWREWEFWSSVVKKGPTEPRPETASEPDFTARETRDTCEICTPSLQAPLKDRERPRFERMASPTLNECISIFQERGGQYGDTWEECLWVKMRSAGKLLGIDLSVEQCRLLGVSAFCDMKYFRELGGYKPDSPKDGINYEACRVGEIAEYMKRQKKQTHEYTTSNAPK